MFWLVLYLSPPSDREDTWSVDLPFNLSDLIICPKRCDEMARRRHVLVTGTVPSEEMLLTGRFNLLHAKICALAR